MSAIEIVSCTNNKIHIKFENLKQILDSIGEIPVAIVSINGPMRTGKSYMLGNILKYLQADDREDWFNLNLNSAFHWKSSSERQTTGIMMWSEPFYIKHEDSQIAILLLDTQGCFDEQTTTHENHVIFALSCLMSSVLIYNIQNKLSEDVLHFLQLFIDYAKASMDYTSSEAFSKLVLLIRDWEVPREFAFGYHNDTVPTGGRNYKKEKLETNKSMATEVQVVHQEILSSFQSVECCLMPHPGKELARNDDTSKLDEQFIETIKDFVPKIFGCGSMITKKIGGKEVTGIEFKKIVKKWYKLFEESEIPEAKNVTETIAETQAMMAYTTAMNYYKREMESVKSQKGMKDDELEHKHQKAKQEALDLFNDMKRIKIGEIDKKVKKSLKHEIDNNFTGWRDINTVICEIYNQKSEWQAEKNQMEKEFNERIEAIERKLHDRKRLFAGVRGGASKMWGSFKGIF